jgi:hypothetical protein
MELEETMKDLKLLKMKCDSEKKFRLTKISEARCVAIYLRQYVEERQ